jgi:membrane fusion protein (multidrug efflux system)
MRHHPGHRRWDRAAVVLGIVLAAFSGCGPSEQAAPQVERPTILATPAVEQTVPVYADHVGQTQAVETVGFARVEGFLQERKFTEGALVKQGQVPFVIDPQPFQEALRRELRSA